MIKNERQYRITKAQAEKFEQALEKLRPQVKEAGQSYSLLQQVQIDALQSQLDDLRAEMKEYETLKHEQPEIPEIDMLTEIPRVLIQAHVAAGLTQKELASMLGLREQQIQRYEATEYASASFSRISEIARAISEVLKAKR
jgi:ribosome-binding protein aMBF1 (putative translation factor)